MSKTQYRVVCALNGSLRNRMGPQRVDALFQDLGNLSLNNSQIRRLLVDHDYLVNNRPPPDSAPPASAPERRQP